MPGAHVEVTGAMLAARPVDCKQRFVQCGIRGIDAALLNSNIQVLAKQCLDFILHLPGKQSCPEIRGSDGIGFGHDTSGYDLRGVAEPQRT
jgi:hypothetical protein